MRATITVEVEFQPSEKTDADRIIEALEEKIQEVCEENKFVSSYLTSTELEEG